MDSPETQGVLHMETKTNKARNTTQEAKTMSNLQNQVKPGARERWADPVIIMLLIVLCDVKFVSLRLISCKRLNVLLLLLVTLTVHFILFLRSGVYAWYHLECFIYIYTFNFTE